MIFLTKKFKADQKKRRDLQSTIIISPDSSSKKKKSGPLILRSRDSDKRVDHRHPFPFYNSIPPYTKGDIPEHIDEYIHHLLTALEQARTAYDELDREKRIH